jgi:hypothetical protein
MRPVIASALAVLAALALPADALGAVGCEAQATTVAITATAFGEGVAITRDGQAIDVSDDRTGTPVACSQPPPTVRTVDTIELNAVAEESFLYLDLSHGRLAPGATPESERTSEIELSVEWPSGFLGVGGSRHDDRYGFAPGNHGETLGYLTIDPDPEVTTREVINVLARGRGGDDWLVGFSLEDDGSSSGVLRVPAVFEGGPGNDLIGGGTGPDVLTGGSGNDRIFPGKGRNDVDCGGGRDRVFGGTAHDTIRHCERVRQ